MDIVHLLSFLFKHNVSETISVSVVRYKERKDSHLDGALRTSFGYWASVLKKEAKATDGVHTNSYVYRNTPLSETFRFAYKMLAY